MSLQVLVDTCRLIKGGFYWEMVFKNCELSLLYRFLQRQTLPARASRMRARFCLELERISQSLQVEVSEIKNEQDRIEFLQQEYTLDNNLERKDSLSVVREVILNPSSDIMFGSNAEFTSDEYERLCEIAETIEYPD